MKWRKVRLDSVCESISDGDHLAPPKSDSGVPFITISNIDSDNNIDFTRCMYVPRSYYENVDSKRKPQKDDVLYSVVGSFGKPVLMRENAEFVFQRHIAILRPKSDILLSRFLYATMLSPAFYALADAAAVGTAQRTISLSSLRGMEISLPPLHIQHKIAEILGAYDDAIENNHRRIELLEKMSRELYRERFVRRAGEGLEMTLLDVFDYVRGKSYVSNEIDVCEGVPMVNLKNIRAWGGYNAGAERLFSGDFKQDQTLVYGDVIMGVTDMTQDRRIVGHVALVPTLDQVATFSMDIIKLIPKGMSNVELYSILQYSGVSKEISQLATGATVLHLRPSALDSVRLCVPQKSDFERVEGLFAGYYSEIDNLTLQNRNLAKQRDRLLPRLMSGKIGLDKLVKEVVHG